MKDKKGGFNSGEQGGTKILHHSVASTVRIEKTYKREVEQGVWEDVIEEDWYDYSEIIDLFQALKKASEGNLKWLFKLK